MTSLQNVILQAAILTFKYSNLPWLRFLVKISGGCSSLGISLIVTLLSWTFSWFQKYGASTDWKIFCFARASWYLLLWCWCPVTAWPVWVSEGVQGLSLSSNRLDIPFFGRKPKTILDRGFYIFEDSLCLFPVYNTGLCSEIETVWTRRMIHHAESS